MSNRTRPYSAVEKFERNMQMYQERLDGHTYKVIGIKYGVTTDRARQICDREARHAKQLQNFQLTSLINNLHAIKAIAES